MRRGSRELRLSLSADSFRSKRTHDASLDRATREPGLIFDFLRPLR